MRCNVCGSRNMQLVCVRKRVNFFTTMADYQWHCQDCENRRKEVKNGDSSRSDGQKDEPNPH